MRILLATLAGAITLFVLGYLIWGMLLASYFKDNEIQYAGLSKQPAPKLVSFFLSNLALAFLLAFVFDQWASISTFVGGLGGGAMIGVLIRSRAEVFGWVVGLWLVAAGIIIVIIAFSLLAPYWHALLDQSKRGDIRKLYER